MGEMRIKHKKKRQKLFEILQFPVVDNYHICLRVEVRKSRGRGAQIPKTQFKGEKITHILRYTTFSGRSPKMTVAARTIYNHNNISKSMTAISK
jgi:hypothetical protein